MTAFRVARLWVYPIKSLGGIEVDTAEITAAGSLRWDREWVVTAPDYRMLWQGDLPRMALSRCRFVPGGIEIAMPDADPFLLQADHHGTPATITQYGHSIPGQDAGELAAEWLSATLGAPVRLVRIGAAAHAWGGLNPVHVISTASLAALNADLAGTGERPVEIERFRPNILLDGGAAWFEEDHDVLHLDQVALTLREPCVRCELPNISRIDATRDRQPLKRIGAMAKLRPNARPASFGTYAHLTGEAVAVGAQGNF